MAAGESGSGSGGGSESGSGNQCRCGDQEGSGSGLEAGPNAVPEEIKAIEVDGCVVGNPGEAQQLIEIASAVEKTKLVSRAIEFEEKAEREGQEQIIRRKKTEFAIVAPAGRGRRRIITSTIEEVEGKKKGGAQKKEMFRKQIGNCDSLRLTLLSRNGIPEVWFATSAGVSIASKDDLEALAGAALAMLECMRNQCSISDWPDAPPKEIRLDRKKYLNVRRAMGKCLKEAKNFSKKGLQ